MRQFCLVRPRPIGWASPRCVATATSGRSFVDQTRDTKTPLRGRFCITRTDDAHHIGFGTRAAPDQAAMDLPMSSMVRLTALIFAALTCKRRAVSRIPLPDANARLI